MLIHLRSLLVCTALTLSAVGVSACGNATKGSGTERAGSATALAGGSPTGSGVKDGDRDDDRRGSRFDPDTDEVLTYGPAAGPADRREIIALLRRYYAAAAAGNGELACSMLYWLFAETVIEEHSHGKGPRALRGNTCAQITSKVFKQRHRELVRDLARFEVTEVQLRAKQGWVRLRFGPASELLVSLHHDRGVWHMNNLLDAGPV